MTKKGYKGIGMEDFVARWYEKTTRKDMQEFIKLAERINQKFAAGGDLLEIAMGPGFLAVEIAKNNKFKVKGLDISKTFIELAKKNAKQAEVIIDFQQGNVATMPFATNSFDQIICRAAFKNFAEPIKALQEIQRVLCPGGTAIIIGLRRDTSMNEIKKYVHNLDLNWINRWIMILIFRFMLLKRAYTKQEFSTMLKKVAFSKVDLCEVPIDLEIWLTK